MLISCIELPFQMHMNSLSRLIILNKLFRNKKQRVVIYYNCKGEGHVSKQRTKPKRKRDDSWFKDKALLVQAQANGQILHDEELQFLADPGIPEGQATQTSKLKFNSHKDAKTLMEAIEKRFRGNTETKKVQKTLLKQQFENFSGSSFEGLDQIHDRLQKLVVNLRYMGFLFLRKMYI
uniref:Uncharacterized protein n=1 Tax=Tanacetum cinerariifolium TaxID=118510 RepID=A0A6L2N191_TANCI|nr:hypothetical protein [Tanacetum cinerariifolium]